MSENDQDQEFIGVAPEERQKRNRVLDKTTGQDLRRQWAQQDRSEIDAQERAIAPPITVEPRCRVCTSEYRVHIERQIIKGLASYQMIADEIPPDKEGRMIDRRSIKNHYLKHMPIEQQAQRALLEEEADLMRQNYEEGVKGALTDRGMLRVLVRKAYQDAMDNSTVVEPKDLIQMIKLQNEMEAKSSDSKTEELEISLRIFTMAIQNVVPQELVIAIVEEVRRLKGMDGIEFAMEEHFEVPAPKMIEAEVVDQVSQSE